MEILTALGVNSTIFIQFAIFIVAYLFLTNFIFKPYQKAHEERVKRTEGNTDLAERIISETEELHQEYEKKAQSISSETKQIYDQERTSAMKAYDQMVSTARASSKEIFENTRNQIKEEALKAKNTLTEQSPELARVIINKMVGIEK